MVKDNDEFSGFVWVWELYAARPSAGAKLLVALDAVDHFSAQQNTRVTTTA